MNLLFLSVEIGTLILFLLCLFHSAKYKKQILLVSAAIYAFAFENLNMMLSSGNTGGYSYNPGFITIWNTPVFIILAWGVIIYTAMLLSETFPVKKPYLPFLDAVLVLLIDLSVDAVAIRFNFWAWHGYSFSDGYFGVPAGNFIGWMLIVLTFSFFARNLHQLDMKNNLKSLAHALIFIPAYSSYLLLYYPFRMLSSLLSLNKFQQLFLFALLLSIFVAVIAVNLQPRKKKSKKPNIIAIVRWPFHLFAFAGLLYLAKTETMALIIPLLAVSVILIAAEVILMK